MTDSCESVTQRPQEHNHTKVLDVYDSSLAGKLGSSTLIRSPHRLSCQRLTYARRADSSTVYLQDAVGEFDHASQKCAA